ncbi:TetR-like C-terminal domain-containing protein [Kitasatospora kifunensis]|uniref:Tetracyclin repressor-like C-terminal domain-containing protein n=1 Tax=Kitasatospora kifunensis TaxID=58351 RepID=A0A7W7QYD3_KITKI|nr:TetR-like C-terminal domain-containing protein [Kitasatospora kifunensis]MBB4922087.1 hypothetical protein [Kitasatospora kifunensis]
MLAAAGVQAEGDWLAVAVGERVGEQFTDQQGHVIGDLASDLTAWAEQFFDEMASPAGRAYIRDALLGDPDGSNAGRCSAYAAEQIDVILTRAAERGEDAPDTETVIDHVVAPLMYRILFRPDGLDASYAHQLVATVVTPLIGRTDGS